MIQKNQKYHTKVKNVHAKPKNETKQNKKRLGQEDEIVKNPQYLKRYVE